MRQTFEVGKCPFKVYNLCHQRIDQILFYGILHRIPYNMKFFLRKNSRTVWFIMYFWFLNNVRNSTSYFYIGVLIDLITNIIVFR